MDGGSREDQSLPFWTNNTIPATPQQGVESDYPDFTQIPAVCVTLIVLYFAVMVLAVAGNLMVCYVVFANRKMHTVVNYYIVNLAVCDFMVGAFVLPVKLLELTAPASWNAMSDGLCTAMLYLQTIFVFASVLTLVATCLERYFAIVYPLESRMQQSKRRAKRILCAVWCSPCTVALPYLYPANAEDNVLSSHYGTITRLTCFIDFPPSFRVGYYTFLFIFIYFLPLSFIGGTCFRIARCLLRGISFHRQGSLRRQEANRRKVAKMIVVVVIAFAVSWTPYFLVTIVTQYQQVNFFEKQNYFFTMLCINLFAFINSCINPFIYCTMSSRFRNGFRDILCAILCLRVSQVDSPRAHNQGSQNTSDSSDQTVQQTAVHTGGSLKSIRSLVGCIAVKRKSLLAAENIKMNGLCRGLWPKNEHDVARRHQQHPSKENGKKHFRSESFLVDTRPKTLRTSKTFDQQWKPITLSSSLKIRRNSSGLQALSPKMVRSCSLDMYTLLYVSRQQFPNPQSRRASAPIPNRSTD